MTWVGDLIRLTRIAATFRRTGALEPALTGFGVTPGWRSTLWALTTPLWPLGRVGAPSLPPLARALSALGPSYVKLGQVLSTRPDLIGEEITDDLRHLQDDLPAFSMAQARRAVEDQFGRPVEALFAQFDTPVAAASIAQVHPALTKEGRRVAVKILRPGIERAFARDISGFFFVARLVERVGGRAARRLRPTDVVAHFESVVSREMDLRVEAAAGSEYAHNIRDEAGVRAPEMIWELTSKRVLTTSWVDGDRLTDLEALRARGLDLSDMAVRLVRLFLRTALRDGYFHADMHQGNMKVAPDGVVVAFDFGIMGRIDAKTRRTYAEILFSYLTRDYRRGAQAHFDAGYVSRDYDLETFAQALRAIGEPIVGRQASKISMARLVQQLFEVTERFGMETRPELILLQRTMVVVEGVARSLDPNVNMWEAARPEVERFMTDNLGPRAVLRDLGGAVRALARLGPRLPSLAEQVVALAEEWRGPEPSGRDAAGGGAPSGVALGRSASAAARPRSSLQGVLWVAGAFLLGLAVAHLNLGAAWTALLDG